MDRAERRQRRFEQKVERGDKLQGSEAGSWPSKANRLKCCQCGIPKGKWATFRAGPAGPNSLCDACGLNSASEGTSRGAQNASREAGATVFEERAESNLSLKDLQAQLHLSEVKEMKWQKIAAERLEENKELRSAELKWQKIAAERLEINNELLSAELKWQKIAAERLEINEELLSAELKWQKIAAERSDENKVLRTEIQCLNGKIKEMTEANAACHKQFETQIEKERHNEAIKRVKDWVKDHSSLVLSEIEKLRHILPSAKSNMQSTQYQAGLRTGDSDEATADANVCTGVSSKRTGNFDRRGCESGADLNVDVEQTNSGYPQRQTENSGGHGCKRARPMDADGRPNECPSKTEKSIYVETRVHDSKADMTVDICGLSCQDDAGMSSELQKAPSIENVGPAGIPSEDVSEVLITLADRKSALALVSKEFLTWLIKRTRLPTSTEMSLHKSQVKELDTAHWTGLSGRRLLDRFHADTEMERPSLIALNTLLRSVLHVVGSSRRDDMWWCLVWADCMNLSQLPGYMNSQQDTKRALASDTEVATKSAKLRQS